MKKEVGMSLLILAILRKKYRPVNNSEILRHNKKERKVLRYHPGTSRSHKAEVSIPKTK